MRAFYRLTDQDESNPYTFEVDSERIDAPYRTALVTPIGADGAFDLHGDARSPLDVGRARIDLTLTAATTAALDAEIASLLQAARGSTRSKGLRKLWRKEVGAGGDIRFTWARLRERPDLRLSAEHVLMKPVSLDFWLPDPKFYEALLESWLGSAEIDDYLILSGNEITDAVRTVGEEGDGRTPPDSSFGIWEATTNVLKNGGFESSVSNWIPQNLSSFTPSTNQRKFGLQSGRMVATGSGTAYIMADHVDDALTAGDVWTLSGWVYVPVGVAGKTVRVEIQEYDNGTPGSNSTADFVSIEGWNFVYVIRILTDATIARLRVRVKLLDPASGDTVYCDGLQLEEQPIATPYVETDGGTASRSAARVQMPASLLDETQGWVAIRMRMGWPHDGEPYSWPVPMSWWHSFDDNLELVYNQVLDKFAVHREAGGSAASEAVTNVLTFAKDDYVTVVAAWTATAVKISANGDAFNPATNSNIPDLSAGVLTVGARDRGTAELHIDSDVLWFACGTGTLSDADAATIHGFGNNDPDLDDFPSGADVRAVWKADTEVYDRKGYAYESVGADVVGEPVAPNLLFAVYDITQTPFEFNLYNKGVLETRRVVFRFASQGANGFTNPKIENLTTGQEFESTTDGADADDVLSVNCSPGLGRARKSTDGGATWTDDTPNLSIGATQAVVCELAPGDNRMRYTDGAVPNLKLYVWWLHAYED